MIEILIAILSFMTGISRTNQTCNFHIQDTSYNTGWLAIGQPTYTCDAAGIIFNGRYWTAWSQQPDLGANAQPWIASLLANSGPDTLINQPLETNPNIETWNLQHPRFFIKQFPEGYQYLYLCYQSVDDPGVELCWLNYQNPNQWWVYIGKLDKHVFLPSVR